MPECPSLELGDLERTKPTAAMGLGEGFPSVPADMALLEEEQQAAILVQTIGQAAESYSSCELNRQILIEWIVNEPIPEDE